MTGDENPFPALSKHIVEGIVGDKLDDDLSMEEVVAEAQKTYIPFFIIGICKIESAMFTDCIHLEFIHLVNVCHQI
jgi:hypothetical protein